ncbi:4'-phosphopantetheinyl transferase superfamily protein [uncultured Dysosmobacter sp.]|uniref:4'-phosphopantetheinyl transferase family protein n=1 Tax=uncultured Dysosmobacter sp. TaxID=2591384 RepID=UPI002616480E|nr:4'-phosphopantetheinyl transferase [uncultured Dysosmobacter sp.]
MAITLWAARLDRPLTAGERAKLLEALPLERRHRLSGPPEKQAEILCAYWILRRALEEQYQWRELPLMETTPLGKPFFPDWPQVCFSVSHTAGAVLAGVSDQPIGVDIQAFRPVSRRLLARMGAPAEEEFFRLWVRREARGKRTGRGVGAFLREEPPLAPDETYRPLELFPGYAAGVSAGAGQTVGRARVLSLTEMLAL